MNYKMKGSSFYGKKVSCSPLNKVSSTGKDQYDYIQQGQAIKEKQMEIDAKQNKIDKKNNKAGSAYINLGF